MLKVLHLVPEGDRTAALPRFQTCLRRLLSCKQVVRPPVGLAVVKVLRLVPEDDKTRALPRVLTSVANLLKSRQQGVR